MRRVVSCDGVMMVDSEELRNKLADRLIRPHQQWLVEQGIDGLVLVAFTETEKGLLGVTHAVGFQGAKSTEFLEPARVNIVEAIKDLYHA